MTGQNNDLHNSTLQGAVAISGRGFFLSLFFVLLPNSNKKRATYFNQKSTTGHYDGLVVGRQKNQDTSNWHGHTGSESVNNQTRLAHQNHNMQIPNLP